MYEVTEETTVTLSDFFEGDEGVKLSILSSLDIESIQAHFWFGCIPYVHDYPAAIMFEQTLATVGW